MAAPLSCRLVFTGDVDESHVVTRLKPVTIGREGDVRLRDPKASRINCRVELDDAGRLEVIDLRSLNGTLVNGQPIERGRLEDGDVLRIGDTVVKVHVEADRRARARLATVLRPALGGHGLAEHDDRTPSPHAVVSGPEAEVRRRLEAEGFEALEPLPAEAPTHAYAAVRTVLEQPVTLRVLDTRDAPPRMAERFLREAKVQAGLVHPGVVRLLDARTAGDLIYMILERLSGDTLAAEIERAGPLTPERALAVALPLARALAYVHGQGVIHRDLRPLNVALEPDGAVKLAGFGLARRLPSELERSTDAEPIGAITRACERIGTAGYAAPEQLLDGQSAGERADVYGFGALLWHALAGRPPEPRPAPLESVREGLAPRLVKLVGRCLREDPDERFKSARELFLSVEAAIREVFGFREGSANVDLLVRYAQEQPAPPLAAPEAASADSDGPVTACATAATAAAASTSTTSTTSPTSPSGRAPMASSGAASAASARRDPPEPVRDPGPPVFVGSFAENELIEIVQMVELNRKSGVLEVVGDEGKRGRVAFKDGLATRARFPAKKGQPALIALLCLAGGRFRLTVRDPDEPEEHHLPIGPLLLEVMRLRDEARFEEA